MKFRNLVFFFVVAVIIAAWFTKPDYDDFLFYREATGSNPAGPPVIEYSDGFLFSQVKVTYFQPQKTEQTGNGTEVAVPVVKEKYIGLFGRFWSLN